MPHTDVDQLVSADLPIQFTAKNIQITPALRTFTHDKFLRLKRHTDNILDIHTNFTVNKLRQIVKATVHLPGTNINASAESENMYKSIDELVDKLVELLDRHKGKNHKH